MAKKNKGNAFIILSIIGIVGLIPLLKAKPSEELEGDVISTTFERLT